MTDIRHICVFSDFNSTLLNLRVLKYKFLIVTIVPVGHILNLEKLTLYVQYNLSSILFKKSVRHSRVNRQSRVNRHICVICHICGT